jgi:HD-GYP domain-containing protein (c-di-GMP phosphodiesterase class II)
VDGKLTKDRHVFEIMVLIVILGMAALFTKMGPHKMVALNLFFVPIILSGYYLGRTSAGVLALFCALAVTITTTLVPTGFAAYDTPIMMGLVLTVWAAVLGLAALLVGTLCDQRAATVKELHRAYVGVVEVLSKYLQGGNPRTKARSERIAELSYLVAKELRLSQKETDDVRVAALLHDLGNVEITTQVISKAFDTLEESPTKHKFLGTELVHSLGSVLEGALPLLVNQDDAAHDYLTKEGGFKPGEAPLGARIIRAVRYYDDLTTGGGKPTDTVEHALKKLRTDACGDYDSYVIDALERVVRKTTRVGAAEPAYA